MFANVIPTEQYNLKNEEFWCAVSTSLGIPNPVCIPHIGTRLVRNAPEEDDDDADTAQRGDEVDPFGQNASKIVQQGSPWKARQDRFEDLIVMLMQHSGMSAKERSERADTTTALERIHTGGLRASGIPRGCPGRGVHRPRTRQGDDSRAEIY